MAKKIVWSHQAETQLRSILEYWTVHNHSSVYSEKLLSQIDQRIKILQQYAKIGIPCQLPEIRFTIIEYYRLYYQDTKTSFLVLYIWDTRQDPVTNKYA